MDHEACPFMELAIWSWIIFFREGKTFATVQKDFLARWKNFKLSKYIHWRLLTLDQGLEFYGLFGKHENHCSLPSHTHPSEILNYCREISQKKFLCWKWNFLLERNPINHLMSHKNKLRKLLWVYDENYRTCVNRKFKVYSSNFPMIDETSRVLLFKKLNMNEHERVFFGGETRVIYTGDTREWINFQEMVICFKKIFKMLPSLA